MTISWNVHRQFFDNASSADTQLIRLPPTVVVQYETQGATSAAASRRRASSKTRRRTNLWTVDEHERFLQGLAQFPHGPWKEIAAIVGTKTTRQTMTHAQKYREKIGRHKRGFAPRSEPFPGDRNESPVQAEAEGSFKTLAATSPRQSRDSTELRPHSGVTHSPSDISMFTATNGWLAQELDAILQACDAPFERGDLEDVSYLFPQPTHVACGGFLY
ncbi:hypothetical protein PINS_up000845 [Pythium insidiosum]|nr:hypothetical protein PINS_up000845 [Pythium insidiosum]